MVRSIEDEAKTLDFQEVAALCAQSGISGKWTVAEFLFVWRSTKLASVAELEALFDVLGSTEPAIRRRYLEALNESYGGTSAMVQVAWVAESEHASVDSRSLAARYAELQRRAEVWGEATIVIDCAASRAALLSEYSGDHLEALAVLDEADKKSPDSTRLVRARAKIQFQLGQYSDVLANLDAIIARIPRVDQIGRAYALRDMAISAAKIGDLPRAIELFEAAREAARSSAVMAHMAVGLTADMAVAQFVAGHRSAALGTYRSAAMDCDQLAPTTAASVFVGLALGAVGAWMAAELSRGVGALPSIEFGACSRPQTVTPSDMNPPAQAVWYLMAQIEERLGLDTGIAAEAAERTRGAYIEAFEATRIVDAMRRGIRLGDIVSFVSMLGEYCRMVEYVGTTDPSIRDARPHVVTKLPWSDLALDPEKPAQRRYAEDAVISFAVQARLGRGTVVDVELASAVLGVPGLTSLAKLLDGFGEALIPQLSQPKAVASSAALIGSWSAGLAPDTLLLASYRIWEWLRGTTFDTILAPSLGRALSEQWRRVAQVAGFALRQPARTRPLLLLACERADTVPGIARLLLAAEDAVGVSLGNEIRRAVSESAAET